MGVVAATLTFTVFLFVSEIIRIDLAAILVLVRWVSLVTARTVPTTLRQWPLDFKLGFFRLPWWIDPDGGRD